MPPASFKDMLGQRFTRLVVVSRADSDKNGNAIWECMCDCGNTTLSRGFTLRNGQAKSCGCLTTDQLVERITTHKMSGTLEWWSWVHMRQRCENPNARFYPRYGGRGIKVCERWQSFENFYADMGSRPSEAYSLERKNNDGHYEPTNCVWATLSEQNSNKVNNHYVDYKGQRMAITRAMTLGDAGVSLSGTLGRLRRGWSVARAVETPPNPNIWTHQVYGKPTKRKKKS